jgi:hypothetical protein
VARFAFGAGFTARRLARHLAARRMTVAALEDAPGAVATPA